MVASGFMVYNNHFCPHVAPLDGESLATIHYLLQISVYMKRKNLLFSSLVWGSLMLASIQALGYTCFMTVMDSYHKFVSGKNFL